MLVFRYIWQYHSKSYDNDTVYSSENGAAICTTVRWLWSQEAAQQQDQSWAPLFYMLRCPAKAQRNPQGRSWDKWVPRCNLGWEIPDILKKITLDVPMVAVWREEQGGAICKRSFSFPIPCENWHIFFPSVLIKVRMQQWRRTTLLSWISVVRECMSVVPWRFQGTMHVLHLLSKLPDRHFPAQRAARSEVVIIIFTLSRRKPALGWIFPVAPWEQS